MVEVVRRLRGTRVVADNKTSTRVASTTSRMDRSVKSDAGVPVFGG